jgi:hypothetical protein
MAVVTYHGRPATGTNPINYRSHGHPPAIVVSQLASQPTAQEGWIPDAEECVDNPKSLLRFSRPSVVCLP